MASKWMLQQNGLQSIAENHKNRKGPSLSHSTRLFISGFNLFIYIASFRRRLASSSALPKIEIEKELLVSHACEC